MKGTAIATALDDARPGRSCPVHYRYGAASLARPADFSADVIYVVGGLYGNVLALEALERLHALEPDAQLVFNGDFNWFNIARDDFVRINSSVLTHPAHPTHRAIRGNVETELLADDPAAGCGCGYPEWVGDVDVARSNSMMAQLAATARQDAETLALAQRAAALPMTLVAQVGPLRVGIVHGDAESLAGWDFTQESFANSGQAALVRACEAARLQVIASSHTCLPVAQVCATSHGPAALFNNGAAGMPNFTASHFGVVTRIGRRAAPDRLLQAFPRLYGSAIAGVTLDAIALPYDQASWLAHFDAHWAASSPAALSYRKRIVQGPAYSIGSAARDGITLAPLDVTQIGATIDATTVPAAAYARRAA